MTLERAVILDKFKENLKANGLFAISEMIDTLKEDIINLEAENEALKEENERLNDAYTQVNADYLNFVSRVRDPRD